MTEKRVSYVVKQEPGAIMTVQLYILTVFCFFSCMRRTYRSSTPKPVVKLSFTFHSFSLRLQTLKYA